jgi:hypothetical protein
VANPTRVQGEIELGSRDLKDDTALSVEALGRAHSAGRMRALEECRESCEVIAMRWRQGVVLGAVMTAVTAAAGALVYLWIARW